MWKYYGMQEIGAEKIYVINGQECWTKFKFDRQFIVKAHSNQVNMTKKKYARLTSFNISSVSLIWSAIPLSDMVCKANPFSLITRSPKTM